MANQALGIYVSWAMAAETSPSSHATAGGLDSSSTERRITMAYTVHVAAAYCFGLQIAAT